MSSFENWWTDWYPTTTAPTVLPGTTTAAPNTTPRTPFQWTYSWTYRSYASVVGACRRCGAPFIERFPYIATGDAVLSAPNLSHSVWVQNGTTCDCALLYPTAKPPRWPWRVGHWFQDLAALVQSLTQ